MAEAWYHCFFSVIFLTTLTGTYRSDQIDVLGASGGPTKLELLWDASVDVKQKQSRAKTQRLCGWGAICDATPVGGAHATTNTHTRERAHLLMLADMFEVPTEDVTSTVVPPEPTYVEVGTDASRSDDGSGDEDFHLIEGHAECLEQYIIPGKKHRIHVYERCMYFSQYLSSVV